MAAVVLGGGRGTEEAAAVGRSANYARATDGAALPRAELSSLMTAEVIVNIRISYNVCCVCVMCCGCGSVHELFGNSCPLSAPLTPIHYHVRRARALAEAVLNDRAIIHRLPNVARILPCGTIRAGEPPRLADERRLSRQMLPQQ